MYTNSKTTRRTRWVVWLLAVGVAFLVIGTSWISVLWFTRDTIYEAAPENTVMAVRFFVSGKKGDFVKSLTNHVPLISNRSITFANLAPYISGEFVIFMNADNSQSVAIRVRSTPLPQSLFDSLSIQTQSIGHNFVLLSEKQEVLKPFNVKPKFIPGISFPGHVWIGELVDHTQGGRSFMFAANDHIDISLPGPHPNGKSFNHIPNGTIAYLSTPMLPNVSSDFIQPFLPLMQSAVDQSFLSYLTNLSIRQSQLILTKDKQGVGFLMITEQPDSKNTLDLDHALRSIAALNAPKIQETPLSDGTSIKEIVANPDLFSVEHVTVLGTQVSRIHTNNGDVLAGHTEKNQLFLTNRENLFRDTKGNNKINAKICEGNMAGITLQPIIEMQNQHAYTPNNSPILLFAQNFSSIGVKSSLFSTVIRLCH